MWGQECVCACVGLDGKRVTIEMGVKEECGGGISVKPPENLHIEMYGHKVITSKNAALMSIKTFLTN